MAAAFAVTRHDTVNGVATLTVIGDLDHASGDILTRMTLDAVTGDVKELIVDLTRVTWLDTAGVLALLLGHETAGRANCTYQLANPSGLVRYVLESDIRARRLRVGANS
jgi:anti-anti-sigma factor